MLDNTNNDNPRFNYYDNPTIEKLKTTNILDEITTNHTSNCNDKIECCNITKLSI